MWVCVSSQSSLDTRRLPVHSTVFFTLLSCCIKNVSVIEEGGLIRTEDGLIHTVKLSASFKFELFLLKRVVFDAAFI